MMSTLNQSSRHGTQTPPEPTAHPEAAKKAIEATPVAPPPGPAAALHDTAVAAELARGLAVNDADIWTSTRVARAPGAIDASTSTTQADPTAHANISATGANVGELGGTGTHASAHLDRTSGLLKAGGHLAGHDVTAAFGLVPGAAYAEVATKVGGMTLTNNAIGAPGIAGVGVGLSKAVGAVTLGAALFAVGERDASAKLVDVVASKGVRVQYKNNWLAALQLTFGASHGIGGVGTRLYASRSSETTLERWETRERAAQAVSRQGWASRKLQAFGIRQPAFILPNVRDPRNLESRRADGADHMQVGDEIVTLRSGTLTGGIAATVGGVYVGGHATVASEHQLAILKLDAAHVLVTLTPQNVSYTGGLSFDVPLLGSASVSLSRAKTSRSAYEFDLTKPDAHAAYLEMLDGHLPGPVLQLDDAQMPQLLARIKGEAPLPEGVKLVSLQFGSVPKRVRAEASLSAAHTLRLPFGAVGVERSRSTAHFIHAEPTMAYERHEARGEWRQEMFVPGATTYAASLTREQLVGAETGADKQQVMVQASVSFDRAGTSARKQAVQWLNDTILSDDKLSTRDVGAESNKYSYTVQVQRVLGDEDIVTLIESGRIPGSEGISALWKAAVGEPAKTEAKQQMVALLSERIAAGRAPEVGRLHRILGNDEALIIKTESDDQARLKAQALVASVKYQGLGALAKAQDAKVRKIIERLDAATARIEKDPIANAFSATTLKDSLTALEDIKKVVAPLVAAPQADAGTTLGAAVTGAADVATTKAATKPASAATLESTQTLLGMVQKAMRNMTGSDEAAADNTGSQAGPTDASRLGNKA